MENQQAAHTGSTRMREEAPRIGSMVIFKFGLRLFFQIFIHAYRIFRVTGVSNCWDHLYIGARVAGGIVGLPVQMSCVSGKDKKKFKFWISKKQEENRHVSRLTF